MFLKGYNKRFFFYYAMRLRVTLIPGFSLILNRISPKSILTKTKKTQIIRTFSGVVSLKIISRSKDRLLERSIVSKVKTLKLKLEQIALRRVAIIVRDISQKLN
jgi:hypothetical protein